MRTSRTILFALSSGICSCFAMLSRYACRSGVSAPPAPRSASVACCLKACSERSWWTVATSNWFMPRSSERCCRRIISCWRVCCGCCLCCLCCGVLLCCCVVCVVVCCGVLLCCGVLSVVCYAPGWKRRVRIACLCAVRAKADCWVWRQHHNNARATHHTTPQHNTARQTNLVRRALAHDAADRQLDDVAAHRVHQVRLVELGADLICW